MFWEHRFCPEGPQIFLVSGMKHDKGFYRPNYTRYFYLALLIPVAGMLLVVSSCLSAHGADSRLNSISPRSLFDLEPHYRASVLRGWRSFQTSFARDGLACVHCHLHHETMRLWARAYPKVEVFDGTPYQVKGLRQVLFEALEKHTDLLPHQRLALVEDLVSYIAWWGDGQPIDPGHSRALPPAAEDLAELRSSVERGHRLFHEDTLGPCVRCHDIGEKGSAQTKISVIKATTTFPHYVHPPGRIMSMEAFLSWHIVTQSKKGYAPESNVVTDLAAYLASLAKGKRLHPGGEENASGDQYHE